MYKIHFKNGFIKEVEKKIADLIIERMLNDPIIFQIMNDKNDNLLFVINISEIVLIEESK